MNPKPQVALVHPEIHWNTGNVGRTCLAAGAGLHLIEPLGFSLDDKQVRRSGLDSWPRVQPRVWPNWSDFERTEVEADSANLHLFSAEGETDYWDVDFAPNSILVFGQESVGLPQSIRDHHRPKLLRLPMVDPELRSLNLSTTVAVVLFEVLRQNSKGES